MKKVNLILIYLLFALIILLPVGTFTTVCFGYKFELASIPAFAVVIAVLSVCTFVLNRVYPLETDNKSIRIILSVIAPMSLINAVLFLLESHQISVIVSASISAVCCFLLTVKHSKPDALKTVVLSLSALMALPVVIFSLFLLVFGNFGKNTVMQTVVSPNEKYYAQVIDSDQGALGGDTFVDVYSKGFDSIVFRINKKPQRVYQGEWGEFEEMQIYWKDDSCLVINSKEYNIET